MGEGESMDAKVAAIQPGTEAHRMGKKNNRAAGKWYANREVVPGKRDKQANILPVAETGI